ncbi:MAG: hypothetical protein LBM67_02540 [Lentimicrobiaceae bacterium]|jgi:hypothetical protein|nr:hypothetical protein [Lentimicrobiaceae bacterium]
MKKKWIIRIILFVTMLFLIVLLIKDYKKYHYYKTVDFYPLEGAYWDIIDYYMKDPVAEEVIEQVVAEYFDSREEGLKWYKTLPLYEDGLAILNDRMDSMSLIVSMGKYSKVQKNSRLKTQDELTFLDYLCGDNIILYPAMKFFPCIGNHFLSLLFKSDILINPYDEKNDSLYQFLQLNRTNHLRGKLSKQMGAISFYKGEYITYNIKGTFEDGELYFDVVCEPIPEFADQQLLEQLLDSLKQSLNQSFFSDKVDYFYFPLLLRPFDREEYDTIQNKYQNRNSLGAPFLKRQLKQLKTGSDVIRFLNFGSEVKVDL